MSPTPENAGPPPDVFCQTDWEEVFEAEDSGIIPLVEGARTVSAYRKSVSLIVKALLVRDDDAPLRAELEARLESMLGDNDNDAQGIETAKGKAIAVLRDIKNHRKEKSDECWAKHKEGALKRSSDIAAEASVAEEAANEDATSEKTEASPIDEIQEIFSVVLDDFIGRRLKAVRADEEQQLTGKPAFIISGAFAEHIGVIIRTHVAPHILENSRGLVRLIGERPSDDHRRFITDYFESRNGRADMWEKWRKSWAALTQPAGLPARPKEEKSKGLLGMLKPKNKNKKSWKKELTLDEWKVAAKKIKAKNRKAADLWAEICADSDAYQSPADDDSKLLMDLFARSEKALVDRVSGMRQIVEQGGGSMARNLIKFIGTKDMDLSLLSVSCRKPDLFLGSDGALRDMMKAFDDGEAEEKFPLVMRFLGEKI